MFYKIGWKKIKFKNKLKVLRLKLVLASFRAATIILGKGITIEKMIIPYSLWTSLLPLSPLAFKFSLFSIVIACTHVHVYTYLFLNTPAQSLQCYF